MLLDFSKGYTRYLQLVGDEIYHYVGGATKEELEDLIAIDDDNVTIYGRHLVDNPEDLKI